MGKILSDEYVHQAGADSAWMDGMKTDSIRIAAASVQFGRSQRSIWPQPSFIGDFEGGRFDKDK